MRFALKMSSSSHGSHAFLNSLYVIKINGALQNIEIDNDITYSNLGLSSSNYIYLTFCSFEINNDMNIEIELDHNNTEYRLLFGETVKLLYN